ncbi:hypothetical protein GCM10027060_06460 [Nesterenkonia halophila]
MSTASAGSIERTAETPATTTASSASPDCWDAGEGWESGCAAAEASDPPGPPARRLPSASVPAAEASPSKRRRSISGVITLPSLVEDPQPARLVADGTRSAGGGT